MAIVPPIEVPVTFKISVVLPAETPEPVAKVQEHPETASGTSAVGAVIKMQEEQRITLTVAYPALRKDGHGEFAGAETVEKTAHDWMARSRQIGLYHVAGLVGYGTVVESGIHRGPDWVVKATDGSDQVVHAGDWLMAVRWEPDAWAAIKKGDIDGLSIDGRAKRRSWSSADAGLR